MGVVNAKDPHALVNPELHHVAQCEPQRWQRRRRVKIGIDNVFVLLRRILSEAD
jgi:hypothetical protein